MATFYNSGETGSQLYFVLSGITPVNYTRYVVCHWKKSSSGSYSTFQVGQIAINSSANVNITLGASTPLNAGTSYDAYLTLHLTNYTGAVDYTSGSDTGTTTILPPTGLHLDSVTETTASVGWTARADAVSYEVRWRLVGGTYYYKEVTGTSTTITGLLDNSNYEIDVLTYGANQSSTYCTHIHAVTVQAIQPWEWYYPKTNIGVGTVAPNEWWDFMELIDLVRVRYGMGAYAFTRTLSYYDSGDFFYYWMMTQCATAIYEINGNMGGIDLVTRTVASGDIVYASYFLDLKTALNICINAL